MNRPVRADADRDDDEVRRINKGYAWETNYVRSWDEIVEDPATGRLKSLERKDQIARKRRRDDGLRNVRRGIIRYTVLVLDTSEAMNGTDMKPSRAEAVCAACGEFIREYFDQNPISQLAVITTRDSVARRLSNLSSNPSQHISALQEALQLGSYGDASLQNSLELCRAMLGHIPAYGTREVLIAYGALCTCDPGNIHDTIAKVASEKIRCSTVGLGAEIHILRSIAERSLGTYKVAQNEEHFAELLNEHIVPPATTTKRSTASFIRMGFPIMKRVADPKPFWNDVNVKGRVGYECPRCSAWLSEVPCECVLCGLTLVSSPHLARSYHHLFPVPPFVPLPTDVDEESCGAMIENGSHNVQGWKQNSLRCTGCLKLLRKDESLRLLCSGCHCIFCIDCDAFIHDTLHHCPSCGVDNSKNIFSISS